MSGSGNIPEGEASASPDRSAAPSTSLNPSPVPAPSVTVDRASQAIMVAVSEYAAACDLASSPDLQRAAYEQVKANVAALITAVTQEAQQASQPEIERLEADALAMTRTINGNAAAAVVIAEDRASICEQLRAAELANIMSQRALSLCVELKEAAESALASAQAEIAQTREALETARSGRPDAWER